MRVKPPTPSTDGSQYSGKDIPHLESNIDDRIRDLVSLIDQQTGSGRPIDLAQTAQFFTLDVLTQIAFGDSAGFLVKNTDLYQYVERVFGLPARA